MRKNAQLSRIKLIRCGKIVEIFEYSKPFAYSFDPFPVKEKQIGEEKRSDHLLRAQTSIRRVVNANANAYGYRPIFITYTFAENITSINVANACFTSHIRRLKAVVGRRLRYVCVPEFQEKRLLKDGLGAWHFHVIYFDLPYIKGIKKILSVAWPHGFFKVKSIKHARNVGAYVSKYFCKQWAIERPLHMKSYFSSSGLFQPSTSYQQSDYDELRRSCIICEEYCRSYDTLKYGQIVYKQLRIIDNENNYSMYVSKSREFEVQRI